MSEVAAFKRKYVRLDPSTWSEIEALWEGGDVTLEELETRYGVSRRALQSRFAKGGVIKGAKAAQIAAVVKENVFSQVLPDLDETTARAKATREAAYRNAVVVEELIMAQLAAAQKDPSQALKAAAALKALSLAASGLERIHDLKWRALGLDKKDFETDQLTELVFVDLTEREIEAMQAQNEEEEHIGAPTAPDEDEDDQVVVVDLREAAGPKSSPKVAYSTGPRMVRGAT